MSTAVYKYTYSISTNVLPDTSFDKMFKSIVITSTSKNAVSGIICLRADVTHVEKIDEKNNHYNWVPSIYV